MDEEFFHRVKDYLSEIAGCNYTIRTVGRRTHIKRITLFGREFPLNPIKPTYQIYNYDDQNETVEVMQDYPLVLEKLCKDERMSKTELVESVSRAYLDNIEFIGFEVIDEDGRYGLDAISVSMRPHAEKQFNYFITGINTGTEIVFPNNGKRLFRPIEKEVVYWDMLVQGLSHSNKLYFHIIAAFHEETKKIMQSIDDKFFKEELKNPLMEQIGENEWAYFVDATKDFPNPALKDRLLDYKVRKNL